MRVPASNGGFLAMIATTASTFFLHAAAFRNADQPPVVGGIPKWADVEKNNNPSQPSSPLLPNANAAAESSSSQLDEFAAFAHQLANAARKEIAPYWRRGRHVLGQEIKLEEGRSEFQSASPVTLADRAAERVMRELITSAFPDHGIYGEEYGIKDADAEWVWYVLLVGIDIIDTLE